MLKNFTNGVASKRINYENGYKSCRKQNKHICKNCGEEYTRFYEEVDYRIGKEHFCSWNCKCQWKKKCETD